MGVTGWWAEILSFSVGATTQKLRAAFVGNRADPIGTAHPELQQPTAALVGQMPSAGVVAADLQYPTFAAAVSLEATIEATMQKPVAALTGAGLQTGAAAVTLQKPTAALTGTHTQAGTMGAAMQKAVAAVTGSQASPISIIATGTGSGTSANTQATFTGYTPVLNDLVIIGARETSGSAITVPAGWVNCHPSGGTSRVASDAHTVSALYHFVTATDVTNGFDFFTATGHWSSASQWASVGIILRGVNATPIDSSAVAFSSTDTATPHTFPALTGANLSTGSLVVGIVGADSGAVTYTTPAGWTARVAGTGAALMTNNTLTTAGVNVSATNVTPSVGDEYGSFAIAVATP